MLQMLRTIIIFEMYEGQYVEDYKGLLSRMIDKPILFAYLAVWE